MANLEILGNTNADKRAGQALSLQLSAQSMTGMGPLGNHTLWAMAKILGNSATREGSLVVENNFPNHFGIKELQSSPEATIEQTPGADPEKNVGISQENIPPCDGGHRAWAYLLGAALIEGIMWGFPLTFGVFQSYLQSHAPFENNRYIPVVGVLTTGIAYLGNPIVTPITIKYQKYQRHMICIGWLMCILALLASSFATKLWHLLLTQGFLYGVGCVIFYYSVLSMLNEWFVRRRGLAYGLMFGTASACGLGLPFIAERLLQRYGYATTIRAFAFGMFLLVGPTLLFLRPRLPTTMHHPSEAKFDTSALVKPLFLSASFSNIFQGLAFFLPYIYLPSYASSLSLTKTQSAIPLALLNFSQIFGQIGIGYLSDHHSIYLPLFLSPFFSALSVFLLWGFAKSFGPLVVFSILYGIFSGGYLVMYCRFATSLSAERATGLWLFAIFEFQRGVGNIAGGVVSGLLVKGEVVEVAYGVGRYEWLVLLVGGSMLVSSLGGFGWFIKDKKFDLSGVSGLPNVREESIKDEVTR